MVWVLLGLLSLMIHRIVVERGQDSTGAINILAPEVMKIRQAQGE